jgi:copper homeostasis protein
MTPVLVEACVDSVECALAAEAAGAGRVELCADLVQGGTTPSAGTIALCCERLRIPVFVMIRPRGGDFVYSASECETMRRDIACAGRLGAAGVVFGLLREDGTVDEARTRILVEEARPLAVTFHRAFDVCRDPLRALEVLVRLGVDRVLTSGQAATAEQGAPLIERLVRRAEDRIGILAGGGVREGNVADLVARTGVREVHLRGATTRPSPMRHHNPTVRFGGQCAPADDQRVVTDPECVRRVVRAAAGAEGQGGRGAEGQRQDA